MFRVGNMIVEERESNQLTSKSWADKKKKKSFDHLNSEDNDAIFEKNYNFHYVLL